MNETEIINKLVIMDISQNLHEGLELINDCKISEEEIEYLCKISSIKSLSDNNEEQALAYEIITKLFKIFHSSYPNLYSIAYSILSRLGNFPNRELLNDYGFNDNNLNQSPILKIETISREVENSINLLGNKSLLTDFQKQFFDILTNEKFYSVSAPTSAGKSYVFTLSIIKRFIQNKKEKIVLVVPTRALIKELSEKVFNGLKEYNLANDINVRTVPLVEDDINDKGIIYVLTQERLNTLLCETEISLDTLFVDEAQEIQSNRGVVLQNTLEIILRRFPNINLFFASPLISNPEYFNDLLDLDTDKKYFTENLSPVGQNIIFLSSISRKPKLAKMELLHSNEYIDLGEINFNGKFRKSDRMITLAKEITKDDELTLIYCNNPSDTERLALKIADSIEEEVVDEEIESLINFIEEDIHKDYSLIKCLKKGVSYHYGKVPSTVRASIEKLASDGKLKFVFSTSTLLQGVNLPTKNIILFNPFKGQSKPMERRDFLNLIGRAGRLKCEFQGNIWCIDPSDWENKSFEGEKLQTIESYYIKILNNNSESLIELSKNHNSLEFIEYLPVFGKFYADFLIGDSRLKDDKKLINKDELQKVITECEKYKLEVSTEIIKKHYSIHPKSLNELYLFFKNENDLKLWVPKNVFQKKKELPYEDGTNERLSKIFEKIDIIFLNKINFQYKLYSKYASSWIHDNTLSEIINSNHNYYAKNNPSRTINSSIRETLNIIESYVRFKYVLYTGAYIDILKLVIEEKKLTDDEFENIPNLPLYLECGSADLIVINLISLGLSRLTSIKLKQSKYFSCEEPSSTNCFKALQNIEVNFLDIPEICKQEIKNLLA
ncbi:DEAD/DEAH box helicase [Poseidonibacter antarcticus]|uniref:DEAD/DEAH box helicase n=1 Tax=Poseidonibacter antarcticus TaxID=2478538 RepID=UPI000EF46282|nr:DEAD/DEAH box helicase [Poseidonibacter antarcticus]